MAIDLTVLEAKRYGIYGCSEECSLLEASQRMVEEDVSALVVVDKGGFLAGVISHTDLLRASLEDEKWQDEPVRDRMSREVVCVPTSATLEEVARLLLDHCIHRVVVVRQEGERQRPVAVISSSDLIYHLVQDANVL